MAGSQKEKFAQVLQLVRDGMEERFGRDRIVVQADRFKIKIEHPTEADTFISREYTSAELARASPNEMAHALLNGYAQEKKRADLLAYAKKKFAKAKRVRLLEDDFDKEIVGIVELTVHGARVLAGFSRELWDHTDDFEPLRAHMERHHWHESVNKRMAVNTHSALHALLGEHGWIEWK